jgi:hypothetical protein
MYVQLRGLGQDAISLLPPEVAACVTASATQGPGNSTCLFAANSMLERSRQPFWGLPVPTPADAQVVGWILQYGNLKHGRLQYRTYGPVNPVPVSVRGSDFQMFDVEAWRPYNTWCVTASRAAADCREQYSDSGAGVCAYTPPRECATAASFVDELAWLPASAWFHNFAAVIAERRTLGDGTWAYSDSTFAGVNPVSDFQVNAILHQFVPNPSAVPRPLFNGMAIWLAIHEAMQQPSPSGDPWVVVYAPAIMNAPGMMSGFGADTVAPIVIHYPDGKGGWVTVDSSASKGRMAPPPGAGPALVPPPVPGSSATGPAEEHQDGGIWLGSVIVGTLVLGALVYAATRPSET